MPGPTGCPRTAGVHPGTAYTRVRPDLIVEVSADLALDGLRWRHPARFIPSAPTCTPMTCLPRSSWVSGL